MPTKWFTYGEIKDRIAADIRAVHPGMEAAYPGASFNLAQYIMENALGDVFHDMQGRTVAAADESGTIPEGALTEV